MLVGYSLHLPFIQVDVTLVLVTKKACLYVSQIYPHLGEDWDGRPTIDIIAVHGLDFVDANGRCSATSWS